MKSARHGLVVLAAGASRRLGTSKQWLEVQGETLLHRAARLGIATRPLDALVVVRADSPRIRAALADLSLRIVVCEDAALGMAASLACGCLALRAYCAAALVLQVDQWRLDAPHLHELVQIWTEQPDTPVASAYAGVTGVPAVLPRNWFARLPRQGDQGARELLRACVENVRTVAAPALAQDLDDPDDLAVLHEAQDPP